MASCGQADACLEHTWMALALAVSPVVRVTWSQLIVDQNPEYGFEFRGRLWQTTPRSHIYHSVAE
jgi:hypothetical protein